MEEEKKSSTTWLCACMCTCTRKDMTYFLYESLLLYPMYTRSTTTLLKFWGKKVNCAVIYIYNILKATFKLVKSFYHHVISLLHLKICLTLEKYTKFDSPDKVKSEYILGKRWPFAGSSGEMGGMLCCKSTNNPQRPSSLLPADLMDE